MVACSSATSGVGSEVLTRLAAWLGLDEGVLYGW